MTASTRRTAQTQAFAVQIAHVDVIAQAIGSVTTVAPVLSMPVPVHKNGSSTPNPVNVYVLKAVPIRQVNKAIALVLATARGSGTCAKPVHATQVFVRITQRLSMKRVRASAKTRPALREAQKIPKHAHVFPQRKVSQVGK